MRLATKTMLEEKTFERKNKKKNQQKDVNYKISATYIPNINNYFFNRNI